MYDARLVSRPFLKFSKSSPWRIRRATPRGRVPMRAGERGTRSYDRGPDREQRAREAHRQSSETMNCNGGSSVAGEARKAGATVDSRPIVTCEFTASPVPDPLPITRSLFRTTVLDASPASILVTFLVSFCPPGIVCVRVKFATPNNAYL